MNVQNTIDRSLLGISGTRPANEQAALLREKRAAAALERRSVPAKAAFVGVRTLDPRTALGSIPKTNFAAAPGRLGTSDPAAIHADAPNLNVEGLIASWGKNDPTYDLDGDGIVGMGDLTALLARIESNMDPRAAGGATGSDPADRLAEPRNDATDPIGAEGISPEVLGPPESTPDPALTVAGLVERWGQSDPIYDLDGDGTVGMSDLVQLLARLQEQPDETAPRVASNELGATAQPVSTDLVDAGAPPTDTPELTVEGLIAAWGERSDTYDFDGSGRVDMADLLQFLTKLGGANGNGAPPPGQAPVLLTDMRALAAHLVGNFRANGFTDAPPANLREIIGTIGLPEAATKDLLAQLAKHYPQGIGVNFTA